MMTYEDRTEKRHAFVCTVPSTIIEAVNFIISEELKHADIYIVDVTADSKKFAERMIETKICDNVFFVENVLLTYPITIKKCIECVRNGKKLVKEMTDRFYDFCYYNNSGWLVNSIFYTGFYKGNKGVTNRFIEHVMYSNTIDYAKKPWYMRWLILLMGYRVMDGSMLEAVYFFDKNLVTTRCDGECREMKKLDKNNDRLVRALNHIFDYKKDAGISGKKIVILEQGRLQCDYDKGIWNEVLGRIDLSKAFVKPHPRQKKSIFEDYGIDYYRNGCAPWEIEALNWDDNPPIHISLFSTSCISPKYYLNKEPKVIYLYKLCDKTTDELLPQGGKNERFIEAVRGTYTNPDDVAIPETKDELIKIIEKMGEQL